MELNKYSVFRLPDGHGYRVSEDNVNSLPDGSVFIHPVCPVSCESLPIFTPGNSSYGGKSETSNSVGIPGYDSRDLVPGTLWTKRYGYGLTMYYAVERIVTVDHKNGTIVNLSGSVSCEHSIEKFLEGFIRVK